MEQNAPEIQTPQPLTKEQAEVEKLVAEKLKIETEQQKTAHELQLLQDDSKRFVLFRDRYLKNLISAILGISILGFYIIYAIIPMLKKENLDLQLENSQKAITLHELSITLKNDSIKYNYLLLKVSQLEQTLLQRELVMNLLKADRAQVDSAYAVLLKNTTLNTQQLSNAQKLLQKYTTTKIKVETSPKVSQIVSNSAIDIYIPPTSEFIDKDSTIFASPITSTPNLENTTFKMVPGGCMQLDKNGSCYLPTTFEIVCPERFAFVGAPYLILVEDNNGSAKWNKLGDADRFIVELNSAQRIKAIIFTGSYSIKVRLACKTKRIK